MNIFEVKKEEYKTFVVNPFSGFDTIDFIELNKHKVRDVKYFIFENKERNRCFKIYITKTTDSDKTTEQHKRERK